MVDIFDAKILCKNCNLEMKQLILNKQGSEVRAVQCPKCKEQIIHPADLNALQQFHNLKGKTYNVKLRVIGNSHAISIPKEIVNFIREQERIMDDMVRLCFEDMHSVSLKFGETDMNLEDKEAEEEDSLERAKNRFGRRRFI